MALLHVFHAYKSGKSQTTHVSFIHINKKWFITFCNCFFAFTTSGLVTFHLFSMCLVNLFHVAYLLTQTGIDTPYTAACPIWNGSSWDLQCGLVLHEIMWHYPIMLLHLCMHCTFPHSLCIFTYDSVLMLVILNCYTVVSNPFLFLLCCYFVTSKI